MKTEKEQKLNDRRFTIDIVAICGANSINAITDIIHLYLCGSPDRLAIQIRIQDAIDQLDAVKKQIVLEDGELYTQPPAISNGEKQKEEITEMIVDAVDKYNAYKQPAPIIDAIDNSSEMERPVGSFLYYEYLKWRKTQNLAMDPMEAYVAGYTQTNNAVIALIENEINLLNDAELPFCAHRMEMLLSQLKGGK